MNWLLKGFLVMSWRKILKLYIMYWPSELLTRLSILPSRKYTPFSLPGWEAAGGS